MQDHVSSENESPCFPQILGCLVTITSFILHIFRSRCGICILSLWVQMLRSYISPPHFASRSISASGYLQKKFMESVAFMLPFPMHILIIDASMSGWITYLPSVLKVLWHINDYQTIASWEDVPRFWEINLRLNCPDFIRELYRYKSKEIHLFYISHCRQVSGVFIWWFIKFISHISVCILLKMIYNTEKYKW